MDTETLIIRGKKILVKPYILPHISKMTEEEKISLEERRYSEAAGLLCIPKQAPFDLGNVVPHDETG